MKGFMVRWEIWPGRSTGNWPMFMIRCPACMDVSWTARCDGMVECESCHVSYGMPDLPSRAVTGPDPEDG